MFEFGQDVTPYRRLDLSGRLKELKLGGRQLLLVPGDVITELAAEAMHDVMHLLRPSHLQQLRNIFDDPKAGKMDRYVAFTFLRNANIAAGMVMPGCQDTGTATVYAWKGQSVWTDGNTETALCDGIRQAYTQNSYRYSQVSPLAMYRETNSGDNLPAQIDIYATDGSEFGFLFVAKGGGSANKTSLIQASPSLLAPDSLIPFLIGKIKEIGTHACPPYHLAIVIGGTSPEANLKTVKLASCRYLDEIPTSGGERGRAFRDLEMEEIILDKTRHIAVGSQFGGRYFCHDVRVIRLPRHGGSLPIGIGVSCNADRQIKAKINSDGVFLEELERNPAKYLPDTFDSRDAGGAVELDLNQPMRDLLATLIELPIGARLSLSGLLTVARDSAHKRLRELVSAGHEMPDYMKEHPIFYAGPAKTPAGMVSGAFGPTTGARMDPFLDQFMSLGASLISLAKGNRSRQACDACRKHGAFYLSTIGGAAAVFANEVIRSVEVVDFEDLGMEAVWRISVQDLPAFIAIDHRGADFYSQLKM